VAEFPTAGITVDLLQVNEPSTLVVDIGANNTLAGNIQVSVNELRVNSQ
jgi:hypothetical protein